MSNDFIFLCYNIAIILYQLNSKQIMKTFVKIYIENAQFMYFPCPSWPPKVFHQQVQVVQVMEVMEGPITHLFLHSTIYNFQVSSFWATSQTSGATDQLYQTCPLSLNRNEGQNNFLNWMFYCSCYKRYFQWSVFFQIMKN